MLNYCCVSPNKNELNQFRIFAARSLMNHKQHCHYIKGLKGDTREPLELALLIDNATTNVNQFRSIASSKLCL